HPLSEFDWVHPSRCFSSHPRRRGEASRREARSTLWRYEGRSTEQASRTWIPLHLLGLRRARPIQIGELRAKRLHENSCVRLACIRFEDPRSWLPAEKLH